MLDNDQKLETLKKAIMITDKAMDAMKSAERRLTVGESISTQIGERLAYREKGEELPEEFAKYQSKDDIHWREGGMRQLLRTIVESVLNNEEPIDVLNDMIKRRYEEMGKYPQNRSSCVAQIEALHSAKQDILAAKKESDGLSAPVISRGR